MPRDWSPYHRRHPLPLIEARLRDQTRTCREIAAELGYSQRWMANLSVQLGITRKRGGDRKSAAARERFSK